MISLKRKKGFFNIEELFYYNKDKIESKADIVLLKQSRCEFKGCSKFITLHIDLEKEMQEIEADFKKNTRYEIRRAESKDNLEYKYITSEEDSDFTKFLSFYDEFAVAKSLRPCNKKLLKRLIDNKNLLVSYIESDDSYLVLHYYIADGTRARLLYSASRFRQVEDNQVRNLIGRANRFLHKADIEFFKMKAYKILDLGGIAEDESNRDTEQIDAFKKSFGGERVVEYSGKIGSSILGKIVLGLKK